MARIRSTHPGQWTDEDFVACSYPARLLALALRNEADDRGIFEWKPLGLKMRLMPGDAIDMGALLAELVEKNQIVRFEIEGKSYGAVRNFCRYQRPKKPNWVHPHTPEVLNYVAFKAPEFPTGTEPVRNRWGTGTEKSFQRKEEGGRREDEGGTAVARESAADPAVAVIALFDDCRAEVFGEEHRRPWPNPKDLPVARELMASAGDDMGIIRQTMIAVFQRQKASGQEPASSLGYMRKPMEAATKDQPAARERDGPAQAEQPLWSRAYLDATKRGNADAKRELEAAMKAQDFDKATALAERYFTDRSAA